jgi:NADH-quinone oxidoreductase subunit L
LSVIGGFVNIPSILPFGNEGLHNFLSPVLISEKANEVSNQTQYGLMAASVVLALCAILWARTRFSKRPELEEPAGFAKLLASKWYVDELYDAVVVKPLNSLAGFLKNVVEKSVIDGIVNGVGRFVQYSSRQLRLLQSGLVGNYILFMVLSVVVLFLIFWNQIQIVEFLHKVF